MVARGSFTAVCILVSKTTSQIFSTMSVDDLSTEQLLLLLQVRKAEEAFKASFKDGADASKVGGSSTSSSKKPAATRPATAVKVSGPRKSRAVSLGTVKAFLKGQKQGERTSARNLFRLMVEQFGLTCKTRKDSSERCS